MDMPTTAVRLHSGWISWMYRFVRHGEAMFFEHYPEEFQRPTERYSAFRISPLATVLSPAEQECTA